MTADPLATGPLAVSDIGAIALAVSDIEAIADAEWFAANPRRFFRARRVPGGAVLVRKVKDVIFLRTTNGSTDDADTDIELAIRWFAAAYPGWSPEQIHKAASRALKGGAP